MASGTLSYNTLKKEHARLQNRVQVAMKQLDELEAELADYADAECDPSSSHYIPNNEMKWKIEAVLIWETLAGKEKYRESFVRPTCKGTNCFAVNGVGHSPECKAEHEAAYTHPPKAQGVPERWREAVQRAVDELSIMDESEGIAGFHLNGDVSPWSEGELPAVRDELQALLSNIPPADKPEGEWVKCEYRLPTESDAGDLKRIWVCSPIGAVWLAPIEDMIPGIYPLLEGGWYWKPTGLTRPEAPDMGGEK